MTAKESDRASGELQKKDVWELRLYVAGATENGLRATENLKRICDKYLPDRCTVVVIDLSIHPELAEGDQIIAVPMVGRKLPPPSRKVVGDLSDTDAVLSGLGLKPPRIEEPVKEQMPEGSVKLSNRT